MVVCFKRLLPILSLLVVAPPQGLAEPDSTLKAAPETFEQALEPQDIDPNGSWASSVVRGILEKPQYRWTIGSLYATEIMALRLRAAARAPYLKLMKVDLAAIETLERAVAAERTVLTTAEAELEMALSRIYAKGHQVPESVLLSLSDSLKGKLKLVAHEQQKLSALAAEAFAKDFAAAPGTKSAMREYLKASAEYEKALSKSLMIESIDAATQATIREPLASSRLTKLLSPTVTTETKLASALERGELSHAKAAARIEAIEDQLVHAKRTTLREMGKLPTRLRKFQRFFFRATLVGAPIVVYLIQKNLDDAELSRSVADGVAVFDSSDLLLNTPSLQEAFANDLRDLTIVWNRRPELALYGLPFDSPLAEERANHEGLAQFTKIASEVLLHMSEEASGKLAPEDSATLACDRYWRMILRRVFEDLSKQDAEFKQYFENDLTPEEASELVDSMAFELARLGQ